MLLCNYCDCQHTTEEINRTGRCRSCGHALFHYAPRRETILTRCRLLQLTWSVREEQVRRGGETERRRETILTRCRLLQLTWSVREEQVRRGGETERYAVPQLRSAPRGRRVDRRRFDD